MLVTVLVEWFLLQYLDVTILLSARVMFCPMLFPTKLPSPTSNVNPWVYNGEEFGDV